MPATPATPVAASSGITADAYVPVFLDLPPALSALPERPGDLPALSALSALAAAPSPTAALDLLRPAPSPSEVIGPVDPALETIARSLGEPLVLEWVRHRRGERFSVTLHLDGFLHTAEGQRYGDPTWAASAVSGGTASDGWRVWQAADGRTLAELRGPRAQTSDQP